MLGIPEILEIVLEQRDRWKELEWRMGQKWDCSQNEDSVEEGNAMDWNEDDELRKQWRRGQQRRGGKDNAKENRRICLAY